MSVTFILEEKAGNASENAEAGAMSCADVPVEEGVVGANVVGDETHGGDVALICLSEAVEGSVKLRGLLVGDPHWGSSGGGVGVRFDNSVLGRGSELLLKGR